LNSLYGAVLLKLGEDVAAYQALHHAQQLNPEDSATTDLLYRTAITVARKRESARQYSKALQYLEEAATLRPQEAEPHRVMEEIYRLTDHQSDATAEQRAVDRLSKNPPN
jgi:Flp pilus assembly protein TadD